MKLNLPNVLRVGPWRSVISAAESNTPGPRGRLAVPMWHRWSRTRNRKAQYELGVGPPLPKPRGTTWGCGRGEVGRAGAVVSSVHRRLSKLESDSLWDQTARCWRALSIRTTKPGSFSLKQILVIWGMASSPCM